MKWHVGIWLVAVCLLAADTADDANQKDIQKWQGIWQPTAMETNGKVTPPDELQKIKLTVEGLNYHFQNGAFSEHGTYKFGAAKNPKELDIVVGDGADKGKIYLVIYKFDADQLMICLRSDNKLRPSEFTGRSGSGAVLEVWKRVKP